jgi:hypothetical protein
VLFQLSLQVFFLPERLVLTFFNFFFFLEAFGLLLSSLENQFYPKL